MLAVAHAPHGNKDCGLPSESAPALFWLPMFEYANELRCMTHGKGSFSMEFARYKQVPASLHDEVVARRRAEKEERPAMAH
jgi:hypothetical protein